MFSLEWLCKFHLLRRDWKSLLYSLSFIFLSYIVDSMVKVKELRNRVALPFLENVFFGRGIKVVSLFFSSKSSRHAIFRGRDALVPARSPSRSSETAQSSFLYSLGILFCWMSKGVLDLVNVYFRDFMIMVHGLHEEFAAKKILLDETQPCKFPILRVKCVDVPNWHETDMRYLLVHVMVLFSLERLIYRVSVSQFISKTRRMSSGSASGIYSIAFVTIKDMPSAQMLSKYVCSWLTCTTV